MTPAGKSAIGQVVGNGRRGDVKIHIFAINTNPVTYTAMFTQDNSKVKLDSNGLAAVTFNFAYFRCHTNDTVEWRLLMLMIFIPEEYQQVLKK